MTITVQTTVDIPARRIADLMVTALECNDMTCAWVAAVRTRTPTEEALMHDFANKVWYDIPELWSGQFNVEVWEISDEGEYEGGFDPEADEPLPAGLTKHVIRKEDLDAGLKLMAEKHSTHFADFIAENEDAITADVFFQCVVLKDVVYG
jgi:hypothetical protein